MRPFHEFSKFLTMKIMRLLGYKGTWEDLNITEGPI